jgi:hypothetical protein
MRVRVVAGLMLLIFVNGFSVSAQEAEEKPGQTQGAGPVRPYPELGPGPQQTKYIQELDWDAAALSRMGDLRVRLHCLSRKPSWRASS